MSTKIPVLSVYDENGNRIKVPAIKGPKGDSPYIGHNNNWFVGNVDTGVKAVSGLEETVQDTNFVSVADSEADVLYGLKLLGKSAQVNYSGLNLIDINTVTNFGHESITIDGDIITIAAGTLNYGVKFPISGLVIGNTYTASCASIAPRTPDQYGIRLAYADGTYSSINNSLSYTFTVEKEISAICYYAGLPYSESKAIIIKKPMLNEGSTALSYEPYTGLMPSPSPNYPQDIVHTGCSGNITTNVTGVNLIDFSGLEKTYTGYGHGIRTYEAAQALITLLKNNVGKTFHYSADVVYGTPGLITPGSIIIYGATTSDRVLQIDINSSFTVHEGIADADIVYLYGAAAGETMTISNMQITYGDTAKPYEPYRGSSMTISTPNGLLGIPVPANGNYTDAFGQQWICDEIDFRRGVYIQNVLHRVLTGNESWQSYQHATFHNTYRARINDMRSIAGTADVRKVNMICSHFPYGGYVSEDKATGIGISEANYIYLRFDSESDTVSSIDDLKAFLTEQYANGTPVYFLVQRNTPIETPLTEAELKAYRALLTHSPETNVFADDTVDIEVAYSVNLKKYIDKKISEGSV